MIDPSGKRFRPFKHVAKCSVHDSCIWKKNRL